LDSTKSTVGKKINRKCRKTWHQPYRELWKYRYHEY